MTGVREAAATVQAFQRGAKAGGIKPGTAGEALYEALDVLVAAAERADRLAAVANGLLWLDDNRHNYGTPAWLGYFDAAVVDARAALAADGDTG